MATAGTVTIDEPDAGAVDKRIDNNAVSRGAVTVQRQVVNIGSPATVEGFAEVGAGVESAALRVTLATDSTGKMTVDLGATDNAVLDAIAASLVTLAAAVATEMQVDVVGALPAGSNTIGVVDLGATDNAVLDAIAASLALLDNAIPTGSELQVDVVAALPAGNNNIGNVDLASAIPTGANVIGEVTLGAATGAAGDLAKAVDAVAGASDIGVALLAVRDDALTTLTPADGDYVRLRVGATGALHVTGGGGGTEYTEDVATANPIVGTATMMERDDALATLTPVEGDNVGMRASAEGALWTQDFNSDAILADAATLAGAVAGNEMQVDVLTLPAVDLGANNDVQGQAAHDAAAAGNPFGAGVYAVDHGADPTAVAAGDVSRWYANRDGIPFVMGGHPNIVSTEYMASGAQTNDDMLGAIGTGVKYVITGITVTVAGDSTADVKVRIGFGATTVPTEPANGASVAGVVLSHDGIAAGSGVSRGDGSGILAIGGDGEELRITSSTPTTGQLHVIVTHYTVPA